jgi:hypothetical protein
MSAMGGRWIWEDVAVWVQVIGGRKQVIHDVFHDWLKAQVRCSLEDGFDATCPFGFRPGPSHMTHQAPQFFPYTAIIIIMPLSCSSGFDALERCRQWSIIPDEDEPLILRLLSQSRKSITGLDAEIANLKAKLDALCVQRELHDEQQKRCLSLLAPIRTLHDDVLCKIFADCDLHIEISSMTHYTWRKSYKCDIDDGWGYKSMAHTLAQVCSHWRKTLMGNPSSWSSISVSCGTNQHASHGIFSVLYKSLKLSQQYPLRITMGLPKQRDLNMFLIGPSAMNAVMAESHRWKDINIEVAYDSHLTGLFQRKELQGSLPCLEHISLHYFPSNFSFDREIAPAETPVLSNTPRLKYVTLGGVDPRSLPHLPWEQLTTVSLDEHIQASLLANYFDRVIFILTEAKQLQSLSLGKLELAPHRFYEDSLNASHELPKYEEKSSVQSLYIGNPAVFKMLAGSSFPQLTHLSVWNVEYTFQNHESVFSSFLSTIPQNLISLEFVATEGYIGSRIWSWLWDSVPHSVSSLSIDESIPRNMLKAHEGSAPVDRLAQYLHASCVSKLHYRYRLPMWQNISIALNYIVELLEIYGELPDSQVDCHSRDSSLCPKLKNRCLEECTVIIENLGIVPMDVSERLQRVSLTYGVRIELRDEGVRVCLFVSSLR